MLYRNYNSVYTYWDTGTIIKVVFTADLNKNKTNKKHKILININKFMKYYFWFHKVCITVNSGSFQVHCTLYRADFYRARASCTVHLQIE